MRWEKKLSNSSKSTGEGPGQRWGQTCNAIGGGKFLYFFGGYGRDSCHTNEVNIFDTTTETWSRPVVNGVPPCPRDSHSCTAVGNSLFVFGGTDGKVPLKDLHIFNTANNTWISPSLSGEGPAAREGHSAALVGKSLFIFGGNGKDPDNSCDVYYNDLYILDTETLMWKRAVTSGTPPSARDSHTCSSCKKEIIVVAGEDASDFYMSDVYILDTDSLVWRELHTIGDILPPRAGHTTIALGKHLFVFGGFATQRRLFGDLHVLNIDSGVWTKLTVAGQGPLPRFSVAGGCVDFQNGILAFFGGCNEHLQALDDIYYLYTDYPNSPLYGIKPYQEKIFEAKVTDASSFGYTIETNIDGKSLRGILFSFKPGFTDAANAYLNSSNGNSDSGTGEGVAHASNLKINVSQAQMVPEKSETAALRLSNLKEDEVNNSTNPGTDVPPENTTMTTKDMVTSHLSLPNQVPEMGSTNTH